MMLRHLLLGASLCAGAAGWANAGTLDCAACKPGTLDGAVWLPSAKCQKPAPPDLNFKTQRDADATTFAANRYLELRRAYNACVSGEAAADLEAFSKALKAKVEAENQDMHARNEEIQRAFEAAAPKTRR